MAVYNLGRFKISNERNIVSVWEVVLQMPDGSRSKEDLQGPRDLLEVIYKGQRHGQSHLLSQSPCPRVILQLLRPCLSNMTNQMLLSTLNSHFSRTDHNNNRPPSRLRSSHQEKNLLNTTAFLCLLRLRLSCQWMTLLQATSPNTKVATWSSPTLFPSQPPILLTEPGHCLNQMARATEDVTTAFNWTKTPSPPQLSCCLNFAGDHWIIPLRLYQHSLHL